MKTLLYANRAEHKSISVISILLLAAVGAITKLRCMHRECYIFASQNLWLYNQLMSIKPLVYITMHKYITIINYQLQCKCTNALIYAYKYSDLSIII